jgi:hypothetical protein
VGGNGLSMVVNLPGGVSIPEWMVIALAALLLYYAITLMTMAKKTGTEHGWMAFIPGLHLFLEARVAGLSIAWAFVLLLLQIVVLITGVSVGVFAALGGGNVERTITPFALIFTIVSLIFTLWWWIRIAKNLGKSVIYGFLYALANAIFALKFIPQDLAFLAYFLLNIFVLSVLAWKAAPLKDEPAEEPVTPPQGPPMPRGH